MPAVSPIPTLAKIQAWDTEHLGEAATFWSITAERWEDAFDVAAHRMPYPGGTLWEGSAAEAAQMRANSDLVKVRAAADDLRRAATIARQGEEELYVAKHAALAAVAASEQAGFTVGGDLSVSSRIVGGPSALQAARQVQAQALATEIRSRAIQLVAVDDDIAARITTAAAGLHSVDFGESGSTHNGRHREPKAQLVDRTLPQNPVPDPSPGGAATPVPTAQNIQDAIKDLPTGSQDRIRLVRDPAELEQFEQWVMQHSTGYTSGGNPYRGGPPAFQRQLADGTIVGFGPGSDADPTIDIRIPNQQATLPSGGTIKLHLDPLKGGLMNLPTGVIEPPVAGPAPSAPVPAPRAAPVEPVPEGGGAPMGPMITGAAPGEGSLGSGAFGGGGGGLMVPDEEPWHRI